MLMRFNLLLLTGILFCLDFAFARINSELAKPSSSPPLRPITKTKVSSKSAKKIVKKKKPRKLYLNFSEPPSSPVNRGSEIPEYPSVTLLSKNQSSTLKNTGASNLKNNSQSSSAAVPVSSPSYTSGKSSDFASSKATDSAKVGFINVIQLGYSNSAYRYAGEEYPARSVDFGWIPNLESTCFTIKCIYQAKILGGFDVNNNGKNQLALAQFALRFKPSPWGGYLAPEYGLRGFLPATPKEINDDIMVYGYGGAFSLSTTPEFLGTDFISFTGAFSARKDVQDAPLVAQRDWMTREALLIDFKFSESFYSTLLFSHISNYFYDKTMKEITEMVQEFKWKTNDWLSFTIAHSNIGPSYSADGTEVNTDVVNIDNSVISVGVEITNSF